MQDSVDNASQAVPQLISSEARVLGALMEKQLTTPDQYPLTLNSLLSACNQKSSREPVTNYTQGEVSRTLTQLEHKKFVRKEFGSRADKYTQHFISHLSLTKKHQALLCVMLLRGPQTLSELNTRTQRMVDFSDKNELQHTLDRLCDREVPFVVRLSQQPGQRGERFAHLFSGSPASTTTSATTSSATSAGTFTTSSAATSAVASAAPAPPDRPSAALPDTSTTAATDNSQSIAQLQDDVIQLKHDVATLQAETTELKESIKALYERTGNLPPM